LNRVIPGEPRANTAPKLRDAGAMLKTESEDMLQKAQLAVNTPSRSTYIPVQNTAQTA